MLVRLGGLYGAVKDLILRAVTVSVPTYKRFRGFNSNLFSFQNRWCLPGPGSQIPECFCVGPQVQDGFHSFGVGLPLLGGFSGPQTSDAYLHIPFCRGHQHFLHFAFPTLCYRDAHYQFIVLSFSLASAPLVFTKVLAPVLALLRQRGIAVINYLGDLLLQADTHLPPLDIVEITMYFLQDICVDPSHVLGIFEGADPVI